MSTTQTGGMGAGESGRLTSPSRWAQRTRQLPWWVRVALIWGAARVVTTTMLLVLAAQQPANAWTGASPGYADFATIWDGHWYNIIAVSGYPTDLPMTDDGHVAENAWAFMPVYPAVVRLLMLVTGLEWATAAVSVSVVCALAAALVFFLLMREVLDESRAMFSVTLFCVAPLSPLMQLAYAESMQMLLLTTALYLVVRRRYLVLLPVIVVMSLTRPTGLAFALFLGLHVCWRWLAARRNRERPPQDLWRAVLATVVSGVAGLSWPAIAWLVTGRMSAYVDTELAWRSAYIGHQHLVPFSGWVQGLDWWAVNGLHLPAGVPWGAGGVIVLAIAFTALLFSPPVRTLGVDLRLWTASYAVYLLAVFFPQSSTFRLLMPVFPLLGAVAAPRSWIYRAVVVALSLLGQWGWLLIAWRVDGYDWTPP
ncbi:hypothetical protein GCM10027416_11900 [Okibacterium endophyticum]